VEGDAYDDILRLLSEDEDAFRNLMNDIQDDEVIVRPDDEGNEDDESHDMGLNGEVSVIEDEVALGAILHVVDIEAAVQTFLRRLRMIIQGLKDMARKTEYKKSQKQSTYQLSYSFWFFLRQVPVDELMAVLQLQSPEKYKLYSDKIRSPQMAIISVDRVKRTTTIYSSRCYSGKDRYEPTIATANS
jgi:hypothetical protein